VPRLHVLAVAARLPAWAETACADYAKRMPRGFEIERITVKKIGNFPRGRIVVLDEKGRDFASSQFAALLKAETVFVIGGADGLDPAVKQKADLLLRLSALTLPHALAQVVLLEQIYRGATLLIGHPYHRA